MHEPLAVQEVDSLCDLQKDVQTLVVLSLLREATLSHPVLQVLLPTELHLDVQVHLETGRGGIQTFFYITLNMNTPVVTRKKKAESKNRA